MELKHQEDWPVLFRVAKKYGLSKYQTILLLAMRTVSDCGKGYEFGVKEAKGTDLVVQAEWAAESIVSNAVRYYKLRQDGYYDSGYRTIVLREEEGAEGSVVYVNPNLDFIDFMGFYGGPKGTGWTSDRGWADEIREEAKKVNLQFNKKESNDGS